MRGSGRPATTRGYTIVELLAVLAILGLLATAAFPLTELVVQRDRERELRRALTEIREAIDAYKRAADAGLVVRQGSGYPPDLQSLVNGAPNAREPGATVYFLRRLPRDPFADAALPAAQTWGLRSYQSPPDRPQPGADVYDVYSQSTRVGLDGLPLREW